MADAALLRQAANEARTPGELVLTYDRRSDTLLVHFYGRGIPAVSVPVGDEKREIFYMRVEPGTQCPVGIQIEGFLGSFVAEHPEPDTLLDIAELRGVTRKEI